MKERPILMSAPMVRAILEGRKTQTRRIVKPQYEVNGGIWTSIKTRGWMYQSRIENCESLLKVCPYGKIGDILWVKETWMPLTVGYVYRADGIINENFPGTKWHPSIFMPRVASRIKLEITNIRVERVQDISEEDAIAEGIEYLDNQLVDGEVDRCRIYFHYSDNELILLDAKSSYQTLWESINGKDSWGKNPWVWVIEFKRIKP